MLSGVVIVGRVDKFSVDITEGVDDVVVIKVVDVIAEDEDDACSIDVEVDSLPSLSDLVVNDVVDSDVVNIVGVFVDVDDDIEINEVVSEELSLEALIFSVSNIVNTSSRSVSWSVSKILNDFILKISFIDSFDESSDV